MAFKRLYENGLSFFGFFDYFSYIFDNTPSNIIYEKVRSSINSKLIILSLFFTYGLDLNLRLNTVVKFFFLEILNINNQNIFFYIFSLFFFYLFLSFIIFKIIKTNKKTF